MTAPTYIQQQTPHLFGQTPGYDPFNPFGTSFHSGPQGSFGQFGQTGQVGQQYGQQYGQQWSQPYGQQGGQQGGDVSTLVWQLLGYAQQSIQLAQQIVIHSIQQQLPYQMTPQNQWQSHFGPRGFQRQPMAW